MNYIAEISHRPHKKAKVVFKFDTDNNTYVHNEHGPLRADLLNTMGNKLTAADIDIHYSTIAELEIWLSDFLYKPLPATDKASIDKFKKKSIRALNKIIKENQEYTNWTRNLPEQENEITPSVIKQDTTDFDFDDSNDFNFGADITDEQPTPEPDTKSKDEINLKVDALFIDCARSVESLCLSIAALCRIAIEKENEKPSE